MQWKKVTLIGVGLLGGSLGLSLRRKRLAKSVVGFVRRATSVAECKRVGAVTEATQDLRRAIEGADLVVFCTPLSQMGPIARKLAPMLRPGTIVTDVGSVKASVLKDLEALIGEVGAHFVGSHPLAGGERMGVAAARADLFKAAVCVVTPTAKTDKASLRKISALWKKVGARVLEMDPIMHDQLVSLSSHLPHVVSAAVVNCVLDPIRPAEQGKLCASGFRDSTRIASGSPEMWRDITLANRKLLGGAVHAFVSELQKFQRALKQKDGRGLQRLFETAKQRRDDWAATATSRSPE